MPDATELGAQANLLADIGLAIAKGAD